jgi:hypothetical protein
VTDTEALVVLQVWFAIGSKSILILIEMQLILVGTHVGRKMIATEMIVIRTLMTRAVETDIRPVNNIQLRMIQMIVMVLSRNSVTSIRENLTRNMVIGIDPIVTVTVTGHMIGKCYARVVQGQTLVIAKSQGERLVGVGVSIQVIDVTVGNNIGT